MGIAKVFFLFLGGGSDVHGEFFLHNNVLLLWEKGFVQSLASPGAGSDPRLVSS